MQFRRREKLPFIKRVRELVWPSMGWARTIDYVRLRMFRRAHSVSEVVWGLSIGVAVSFSPILGTQVFQAAFFAWLFRANVYAACVGSVFCNPLTMPFMWFASYEVGIWVMDTFFHAPDLTVLTEENMTLSYLIEHPYQVFLPLLVGGYILAVVSLPITYLLCYGPVKRMNVSYNRDRARRILGNMARNSVGDVKG